MLYPIILLLRLNQFFMKINLTSIVALSLLGGTLLLSNAGGAGANGQGDKTGLQSVTCTRCHSGGTQSVTVTTTVLDASQNVVTAYTPGQTYTVRLSLSGAANGFGFQSTIGNDGTSLGTYATITSNTRITNSALVEQSTRLAASTSTIEYHWTAPVAGFSTVTVYSAVVAADGSGSTSGDQVFTSTLALTENVGTGVQEAEASPLRIYPTLASQQITLEYSNTANQDVTFELVNLTGQTVATLQTAANTHTFDVSHLATGMYVARVRVGQATVVAKPFSKI